VIYFHYISIIKTGIGSIPSNEKLLIQTKTIESYDATKKVSF